MCQHVRLVAVIVQTSGLPAPPPYGLSTPVFRFRALATLAGRAPLGGAREVALATYLVARLVDDCLPEKELPVEARAERSTGARAWLANVALPTPVRASLTKVIDATSAAENHGEICSALTSMIAVIDSYMDAASRMELARLEREFARR